MPELPDDLRIKIQELKNSCRNAYSGKVGKMRIILSTVSVLPIAFPISILSLAPIFYLVAYYKVNYFFRLSSSKREGNVSKLFSYSNKLLGGISLILLAMVCVYISHVTYFICATTYFAIYTLFSVIILIALNFNVISSFTELYGEERLLDELVINELFPRHVLQTTHDSNVVTSINLSVDKLIELYGKGLTKEKFYAQLNTETTIDIEECIKESDGLTEEQKSTALRCLSFINNATTSSFTDNYSKLSLKQITVLCWKACNDMEKGNIGDNDIKNRREIFVKNLIDAATTYSNNGQSCAGGTYNKIVESLSGLHPLVNITLDKKEVSKMAEAVVIESVPKIAKEVFNRYSKEEQNEINSHLNEPTIKYITDVATELKNKCTQYSSLDENTKEIVVEECIKNLHYVTL